MATLAPKDYVLAAELLGYIRPDVDSSRAILSGYKMHSDDILLFSVIRQGLLDMGDPDRERRTKLDTLVDHFLNAPRLARPRVANALRTELDRLHNPRQGAHRVR